MIILHFFQVNNLFLHQSYLESHSSQINLINNAKNHFLLVKKFKNTVSAQLCLSARKTSSAQLKPQLFWCQPLWLTLSWNESIEKLENSL